MKQGVGHVGGQLRVRATLSGSGLGAAALRSPLWLTAPGSTSPVSAW